MRSIRSGYYALFAVIMFLATASISYAQQSFSVIRYEKLQDGLLFHLKEGNLRLAVSDPSVIHVEYTPGSSFPDNPELVVIHKQIKKADWGVTESGDDIIMTTDSLKVLVSKKTGSITYLNRNSEQILAEHPAGRIMEAATVQGEKTYHIEQQFDFDRDEGLYGLGQYQDGLMNYNGHDILMAQANKIAVVPFLVSSNGYGILWDNTSKTWFRSQYQGSFRSQVGDEISYYFVYGPDIDSVVSGYRNLTGKAPMFGKWAYGFWQSKEHYKTRKELTDVVAEYRKRQIPIDNIVQDWNYWGKWGWNGLHFDQSRYPNPKEMMDELHNKYHAHLLLSVWPTFGFDTEMYHKMDSLGALFPDTTWSKSRVYDAFNPEARKVYWKGMNDGLFSKGVDAWWLDGTEPEFKTTNTREVSIRASLENKRNYLGTWARYLNTYSLMTTKAVYEGQRSETSKKRVFILTRSSFAGQQRNAAATWSGDIHGYWYVFRHQITGGLNFCMAGVPYWTTDIGGFFVSVGGFADFPGGSKNPNYRELFTRWFEYGAFCPLFRVHGTNTPREVWQFGDPGSWAYDALVKADQLRYRLLPYIYSLAWKVTNQNYTIMRGLAFDFREDPNVRNIADQFMFGSSILVNPVTEPGAKNRQVYLPKGVNWTDFWSGKEYDGGQTVIADSPIDHIPLFVKQGSIIPMGPVLQYADEKPEDPIELRIYPGADGHFTLYEDENDNYDYEKGIYSTISFDWNDKTQTLRIDDRKGSFPGMLRKRTINVVIVGKDHGTGINNTQKADNQIVYEGQRMQVSFR